MKTVPRLLSKVKNKYLYQDYVWLWGRHFYFSIPHYKGHLQRTSKTISKQNLFFRFQSLCWTAIQKINSKDKAFLEKFRVKESSNLIGLENFWATGCSIMAGLERYSLHQSKNDQISTHHSSSPNFYFLQIKALLTLLLLEMRH